MSYKNQPSKNDANDSTHFVPAHGGALKAAAHHFNIAEKNWLDISTGINPLTWPVPEIPTSIWQRLPEDEVRKTDSLEALACDYYLANTPSIDHILSVNADNVLPCAGSQQGIRLLPLYYSLKKSSKVGIKSTAKQPAKVWVTSGSYSEHAIAWEQQGHRVRKVACDRISQLLTQQPVDVLILVNPDNPSGHVWPPEQLLKWWKILHRRGGWLIVDEAFMDLTPEHSLASCVEREGLFILRSIGKFFGLAGIRLGFVLSEVESTRRLKKMLGPWSISHPTQHIGKLALQDKTWIAQQRLEIDQQSQRLKKLLDKTFNINNQGTGLFRTVYFSKAESVFNQLAKQSVLTRFLPATAKSLPGLRFGLPANNNASWEKLESALAQISL